MNMVNSPLNKMFDGQMQKSERLVCEREFPGSETFIFRGLVGRRRTDEFPYMCAPWPETDGRTAGLDCAPTKVVISSRSSCYGGWGRSDKEPRRLRDINKMLCGGGRW